MHDHLFAQAEALAGLDPTRPRQVNLRRAISAAYYAVFHYLVEESCCMQLGSGHAQRPYRDTLARAFTHSVMNLACSAYAGGTLKKSVIKALPRNSAGLYVTDAAIQEIADAFVQMQEKRNLADYDRNERFKRSEVLMRIESAKDAVAKFAAMPMSDDKRFFLACLWAWKELANR